MLTRKVMQAQEEGQQAHRARFGDVKGISLRTCAAPMAVVCGCGLHLPSRSRQLALWN